ncbi:hypothetical protein I4U23_011503 [Adineta vaga]|nr:hypothetical protein I4U23_011503 [Adineta vaga]
MLFVIYILFIGTFHAVSSLQCYKCDSNRVDFWIDANNVPPFLDDCPVVESQKQCSAVIIWLTLGDLKESLVEYEDDVSEEYRPRDSSLSYVFVDIERNTHLASSRRLIYSCTTDKCNNRANLLRAFQALNLVQNFAQLDVEFGDENISFTEQTSCLEFSNSSHADCPSTASPLSTCSNCFLLSTESPHQICARCPMDSSIYKNMITRQVYFFLENRTRLADTTTFRCTTNACNSLENLDRIYKLSTLEFDFNQFYSSSSSSYNFLD